MLKRTMLVAMTVALLTTVATVSFSQNRRGISRKPDKQVSAPAKSPLMQEAELENRRFWETLFVKCGDSYFGEVAPGLSQMRIITFSIEPIELTDVDRENGYEWRGKGVMRFNRRRMLRFGNWSDWVSSQQDWMTGGRLPATLQKKRGEWAAVYSPFDRNIIAKRPTCEELSQFGIVMDSPAAEERPAIEERPATEAPAQPSSENEDQFKVFAYSSEGTLFINPVDRVAEVTFQASGQWAFWPAQGVHSAEGHPNYSPASKAGPNYKLPEAAVGSLIVLRANGQYEYVGKEKTLKLNPNERVFFVMNDSRNYGSDYEDNEGALSVRWQLGVKPTVTTGGRPTVKTAAPASFECPNEAAIKSNGAVGATSYAIVNGTGMPLTVSWLDYEGKRRKWFELAFSESRRQETYRTHP